MAWIGVFDDWNQQREAWEIKPDADLVWEPELEKVMPEIITVLRATLEDERNMRADLEASGCKHCIHHECAYKFRNKMHGTHCCNCNCDVWPA